MTRAIGLLICVVACGGEDGLSDEELALVDDGIDSVAGAANVVDNVEVVLSGDVDPAQGPDAAAAASVTDAELQVTPSSCITSLVNGNVVMHELVGCTGPGGRMLSGQVISTWTQEDSCLHVEHTTSSFMIGNRAATGLLAVTICRTGATETRDRTLALMTTTRRDLSLVVDGAWQLSLDGTGCATQSGSVTITTPERTIDRGDTDLAWCATSAKPLAAGETTDRLKSGTMVLAPDVDIFNEVTVKFLGNGLFEATDIDGNRFGGDTTEGTGI
jgi:hypothetical protein